MVRYFYVWIPVVIVFGGAAVAVSAALALVGVEVVAFFALLWLARGIVAAVHALGRALSRPSTDPSPATAILAPARPQHAQLVP